MTTATPPVAHAGLDFLGKAALVLLTFQAGGLAHMMVVRGLDGPPKGYLYLVMFAALFAGTQRRLARAQVARGAVELVHGLARGGVRGARHRQRPGRL